MKMYVLLLPLLIQAGAGCAADIDITEYGTVGDGTTMCWKISGTHKLPCIQA